MKTIKLGLIGILLVSTSLLSTNSHAKSIVDTSAIELRNELIKMIQNPNLKQHGIAEAEIQLRFTISQKGEIELLTVNAENEYLVEFVRKKLDKQKINIENIRKDKVYHLTVRFELV